MFSFRQVVEKPLTKFNERFNMSYSADDIQRLSSMRAHFQKVHLPNNSSYSVSNGNAENLSLWHFHHELELHYVVRGSGTRFIGNNVAPFSAGEVILLGANLPHRWKFEETSPYNSTCSRESIILHFEADFLGSFFLSLPEAKLVSKVIERAKKGMAFHGNTSKKLAGLIRSSVNSTGMERIVILLSILSAISETEEFEEITSPFRLTVPMEQDGSRHEKIIDFVLKNYRNDISLEDAAAISNLSATSFCRYFKLVTNKTFNEFLQEIRIGHACRMIVENKFPIDVICFECGFKNVSNFYRHFKNITGMTPRVFKNSFIN